MPGERRRHPGQPARAGTPGQRQQYRLRLVVAGVPEQHGGRVVLAGGIRQGQVAGIAGGCFRATRAVHPDRGRHRRGQSAVLAPGRHVRCPLDGARLQAVVHGHQSGPQRRPGGDESGGGGERQRVAATGAGHQHETPSGYPGKV